MTCKVCSGRIGPRNQSGYCVKCFNRHGMPEGHAARVSAGMKRLFARDPVYLDEVRQRARSLIANGIGREARREAAIRINLWGLARGNQTPESRAKAGRSISATRLAWCPAELRGEYKRLVRSKKIPAAEARVLILEQHEKDMVEFRRKIAA